MAEIVYKKKLDIYPVTIGIMTNEQEYVKFTAQNKVLLDLPPEREGAPPAATTTYLPAQYLIVVWLDTDIEDALTRVMIAAHEAAHVADYIFDLIGESTDDVDEPYAYLVGYVTRLLMEKGYKWTP